MTILGIESSCDDTAAAVLTDGRLLAHIVATQLDHARYGGVVPKHGAAAHGLGNQVGRVCFKMVQQTHQVFRLR